MRSGRFCLAIAAAVLSLSCLASAQPMGTQLVDELPASLEGTWELAVGDPIEGVDGLNALSFRPVRVPGTWQESGYSQHGTVWLRTAFVVDRTLLSTPLAFTCDQIRDSDEVYLDGVLVGRTGSFPPAYDKGTLMPRVYELPATLTSSPGARHLLAVRVYNAGPRAGGLTGLPRIDSLSGALKRRFLRDVPRLLLGAANGALGIFALLFFFKDRKQLDFLFFALYTLGISIYVLSWISLWSDTSVPLSLLFRWNVAGAFYLLPCFLLFMSRLFGRPLDRRHKVLIAVMVGGLLFSLLWPRVDDLYHLLPLAYVGIALGSLDILVQLVKDTSRGVPYARAVLVGSSVQVLSAAFDIGQDLELFGDPTGQFRLLGPTFFLFSNIFLWVAADRFARLRVAATTDPLTGLANRAVLFERIALEVARARRHQTPVSIAVLDLDHFKRFNDRFGHLIGDRLLMATAQALADSVRDTDLAARYGGEEFVVVLPEANGPQAMACLERIRKAVSESRVKGAEEGATISIGLAVFDPAVRATISVTGFMRQADGALYLAKEQGRNRIVVATGEPPGGTSSGSFTPPAFKKRSSAVRA